MRRRSLIPSVPVIAITLLAGCGEGDSVPEHLRIAGAEPAAGREVVARYGCGACHRIPGVAGARGLVGPPLDDFAARTVLAGFMPNAPGNLVPWLLDPPAILPHTAMPNLGLSAQEARDAAAYLYTLGAHLAVVHPDDPALPRSSAGGLPGADPDLAGKRVPSR